MTVHVQMPEETNQRSGEELTIVHASSNRAVSTSQDPMLAPGCELRKLVNDHCSQLSIRP